MRVAPDHDAAVRDEEQVARLVRECLARALPSAAPVPGPPELAYPGFPALARHAQRLLHRGSPGTRVRAEFADRVRTVAHRADLSAARGSGRPWHPRWNVDLPPPECHLTESLGRAVGSLPARPDRAADLAALAVTGWREGHQQVFGEACETLARAWPEMLAELSAVVRQIALLDGFGIDGYTDFTVHGAVFVNSARLRGQPGGLPGHLRLAEALVHEGTHNRCDAAAADPFLASPGAQPGAGPLLATPLRADPRPLCGLFQQVVVLVRGVALYDRLPGTGAVRARRDLLHRRGEQGVAALRARIADLTDHGRAVAQEAHALLSMAPG